MAWVGYYQLNGTEFINVARTSAYAQNAGVSWFRGCDNNPALPRVLGDPDYSSPLQDDAPWTDPDDPNTYGFYGVYPLEVSGIEDGTGSASVTESTLDGGVVGVRRYGTKTIVFNVALLGQDECAVEAGFRWLKRVIAGDPCDDRSDSNCTGADLCYLSCDPCIDPECLTSGRDATADSLARLNYATNPGAEGTATMLGSVNVYSPDVTRVSPSPITVAQGGPALFTVPRRMYLPKTGTAPSNTPGSSSFWNVTPDVALPLVQAPTNTPLGGYIAGAAVNASQTVNVGIKRWIATGLAAGPLGGTMSAVVSAFAQPTTAQSNSDLAICVAVWDSTGTIKRGDLVVGALGSPHVIANTISTNSSEGRTITNAALSTVNVTAGDQLVVEVGVQVVGVANTASRSFGIESGDLTALADQVPNANSTADARPWIEFSQDPFTNRTPAPTSHAWTTFRENTALTTPVVSMVRTMGTIPVAPGDTATFGADLMSNNADRVTTLSVVWVNAGGSQIGTAVASTTFLDEAFPTRVVGTSAAAPANAAGVYAIFDTEADNGIPIANEQVWYDHLTWEVGTTSGSYFDGSTTPPSGDVEIRWAGEVDNSLSQMILKGSPASEPPDFSDCMNRYLRSLRKVVVTTGPTLTAKRTANDGSAIWTATFTAVAGNPFEYSTERPVIEGFMDPAHPIPYVGGVVPEGGSFDLTANEVTEEEDCVVATYQPIIDTTCAFAPMAPPAPPSIDLSCYGFVENFYRRQFILPPSYVPLWDDVVPKIEVHSPRDAELRNLRLRFYPDYLGTGDTTIDPCNFCGDLVVSYLPPNTTLVIDGSDRTTYSVIAGGARQRADHLIFSTDGSPFEWPELTCGLGYIVTVDLPQVQALPVVDLSLYARAV